MSEIRLGSLFDGVGVFPLAAVRCGIVPAWASEIEKAPISITKRHFPGMAHLGDVTKLNGGDILWLTLPEPLSDRQQGRSCWGKIQSVLSCDPHYP